MHWDPEEWFYRAEGGKHVVVYNAIARKVLRIIKAEKGQNVSAEADRAEIERRLKFEKLVIGPLLADSGLKADSGKLVWLPKSFIAKLTKRIEKDRPIARRTKVIPQGNRYAVLQNDFANSIHSQTNNISLELKPKCGWIPAGRKTCYFCFQQLEKIRRGKYESRSAYCPVDLFCPVLNRKRFALAQLFQNPQNNLRFFIDGKLIYSMETIEVLGSAEAGKNFPKILDEVYRLNSLDDILHQLCHRLGSTNNQSGKFCQASIYQPDVESPNLVASGPLAGITRLQQLSGKSANEVLEAFNRLNLKQKKEFEYPDSSWCTSARKKSQDLTDIDIVRRHLISATAKDLSLMIVFSQGEPGQDLDFRLEIVDLDLKPTSKLVEHVTKENAWNNSTHVPYP